MSLGEVNAAMSGMSNMTRSFSNILRFVNKAQSFGDLIQSVKGIGQLVQGVLANGGIGAGQFAGTQTAVGGLDVEEAIMKLESNLPRIVGRAFPSWVAHLATLPRADVRGFVAYLPNPEIKKGLPQITIPTPIRINGKLYHSSLAVRATAVGWLVPASF